MNTYNIPKLLRLFLKILLFPLILLAWVICVIMSSLLFIVSYLEESPFFKLHKIRLKEDWCWIYVTYRDHFKE